jgi:hypothetical protein
MPAKANSGRGSSPIRESQCHVAGLRPSCGSQKDDAGTMQRRSRNDGVQNRLFEHLVVAGIGDAAWRLAGLWQNEPPGHRDQLAVVVASRADDRRGMTRKDGRQRLKFKRAVVRYAKQLPNGVDVAREGVEMVVAQLPNLFTLPGPGNGNARML